VKSSRFESVALAAKPATRKRADARRGPARLARESRGLALAARSFAARIIAFEVNEPAAADLAGRWRQEIDAQERKVAEWFAPAKQAAFKAHAAICRQENEALAPYREARRALNAKLAAWRETQGRRLAAIDQPDEKRAGGEAEAGAVVECTPRVEGVSFRENWRVEVIDKAAFVSAVAARPELINLVEANLAALGHLARAQKGALDIPGLRVWGELSVAALPRP
jgi:hypothetical protein